MPPGLVSPDRFPHRDPMDKSQVNGRVVNPVRYMEYGGANNSEFWNRESRPGAFAQSDQSNIAKVEKPTSVKSAHKSGRENE